MSSLSQEAKGMSFSSAAYYKLCVLSASPLKGVLKRVPAYLPFTGVGYIDGSWSDRLGGMTIESAFSADKTPITFLEGPVTDQAELIGIVNSLYQMHLPLVSVSLVQSH